jgi:Xaa-Pro aminopeptidase
MIKSKSEILKIKKAIEISEQAFAEIFKFIKVGMTELEIKLEIERLQYALGAERMAFDTIVATGKNTANVHHVPTKTRIKDGDILMLDFGCVYKGYHSDITRTVFVCEHKVKSKKQKELLKIYEIVSAALRLAIEKVKDGATCKGVDAAARDYIKLSGYGENFPHATGHGLGLEIHEAPRISFKSDEVLRAGMVLTIEPGIYVLGLGGVRIEEDVLVTEKGCNLLTSISTDLVFV